jgi:glucokinase
MPELLPPGDYVAGVDIGGTKIMAVVFDHTFEKVGEERKRTQGRKVTGENPEDRITRIIEGALEAAGNPALRAIGCGCPGPTDGVRGIVLDTPNLGWKDFPLAKMLEDRFGVPVVLENDVNAGTYGEWRFGEVADEPHVLGVFPGTGIGAGLIVNGQLLHGHSGAAGEIGHMTIDVDGPYCGCGKRGCLESMASRLAIAGKVALLAARGDAPYILRECGTNLADIRSGDLAKAIAAGETMVEGVMRKAAYRVGMAVGNAINLVSPGAVVLGGGLVEAMEDLWLEEVARGVHDHAMPMLRKDVRIVPARLGDYAVARGAAHIAAESLA